jgi:hypothetical protein
MDQSGDELPELTVFGDAVVYQAEIKITAQEGYLFYPSTPFAYPGGKIHDQRDDLGNPTRIIRVVYNNTNEVDIIYVTDYNLQSYIPIPLAGDEPVQSVTSREDVTITVTWKKENPPDSANFDPISTGPFEAGAVYQAAIELRTKGDYRFRAQFDYPPGTVSGQTVQDTDSAVRVFTVTYDAARTANVITDLNLTPYIPKPVGGIMPVSSFAGPQYMGTVTWKNTGNLQSGPFQAGVAYTAEVILSPAIGYTFTGAGLLTHTGALTVTNDPGVVRIEFAAAGAGGSTVVYDTDLSSHIPLPISGGTPVRAITGTQFTGTVSWSPSPQGGFQYDTVYTAVLTLNPAGGYTFAGIGQNVFTHDEASGALTNPANSGTVTITFPPTFSASYTVITSFGPVETKGSALNLLKEKKTDNSITLDLPGGDEEVTPSVLSPGDTSPAKVVINGHGRVLQLKTSGTLLTVGMGVTLTLRNITLKGPDDNDVPLGNDGPLVKVNRGGKLILGEQAILTGNTSAGDVGGVWVNGGELVLNNGAKIKQMEALQAGGVLINNNGKLTMNGGTIEENTASGTSGGGGVLVALTGTFDMAGGSIQSNHTEGANSGGGVLVVVRNATYSSTFTMVAGSIQSNHAEGADSGGGVYTGGGSYDGEPNFSIHGGTIKDNENTLGENCDVYVPAGIPEDLGPPKRAEVKKTFMMTGAAEIERVFLSPYAVITIGGGLSASPEVRIIMGAAPASGTTLLSGSPSLIQGNYDKFVYDSPGSGSIDNQGKYQLLP